jgi:hypothetical protein
MDTVCELNDSTLNDIMDFVIDCVDIPETLRKLSENLYNSYQNRKENFPSGCASQNKLKAKCRIVLIN